MSARHIAVVPSSSIPAGLAAMVAFEPERDAVDNARLMEEAIDGIQSAEITTRCATPRSTASTVREGQAIGIVDGTLVAAGDAVERCSGACSRPSRPTAPTSSRCSPRSTGRARRTSRLGELAGRVAPDLELHVYDGGQPLYPILVSAE